MYVERIMQSFSDCKAGQGSFYFRTLRANRSTISQEEMNILSLCVSNLICTGYLSSDEGDFIKLTQQGYDCMQECEYNYSYVCLPKLILPAPSTEMQFNLLWSLIGKENVAPFYTTGPVFYKTIQPYIAKLPQTYKAYIESLSVSGKSTSRISWYRELFYSLSKEDRDFFLKELARNIADYYKPPISTSVQDEIDEIMTLINSTPTNKSATRKMEETITETAHDKKTVFITYSWETDTDPLHQPWVHKLADDLKPYFNVIIDIEQPLGIELTRFMEQTIAKSDKVLIIATPDYKNRADNRIKGVGYETSLITDDMISEGNRIKFIPIIRKGDKYQSYPKYLGSIKGLPMTDADDYDAALKVLIQNLMNY